MSVTRRIYLKPIYRLRKELEHKMDALAPKILERIRAQEPIDTGLMRRETWVETWEGWGVVGLAAGVGEAAYYWIYTELEEYIQGKQARAPGTRIPWMKPGMEEMVGEFEGMIREWTQAWSVGLVR